VRKRRETTPKVRRNASERAFVEQAIMQGWKVTKRGWPDFICFRDGQVRVVEVKSRAGRVINRKQSAIIDTLKSFGMPCYRWDPEAGYRKA